MQLIKLTLKQKFLKGAEPITVWFPTLLEANNHIEELGRYGGPNKSVYDITFDKVEHPDETLVYGVWHDHGWEGTELDKIYRTYESATAHCVRLNGESSYTKSFVGVVFVEE